ncbi:tetratricopeptide repeat protein [Streptomyces sp. MMG1533]|uniref:tetratricopeptide repeat protein n=1 Tax=Streptomyces sp. MMG1533 TaxID=1415546 RepID=UPI00131ADF29|nr:tetratricopeptide repeat protein [Streptomyces sp. MMG1533]
MDSLARETNAITAYIDESATDVVEVMEAISSQFASQGFELKGLEKMLTTYRQRRHEVYSAAGTPNMGSETLGAGQPGDQQNPTPSSMIGSQLALAGLGMIPGVGAFAGILDPSQVALGTDRIKSLLSARLRNHEDVELVATPVQVLTPSFLRGLTEISERRPWLVLFFDTYERIGPSLDFWLRDILVSERYGRMPANVLIVLAGQSELNPNCWGDWLDLVTVLPLDVFSETEARLLIAARGVSDERVVEVILQLSGKLPVLVSTLAEARPVSVADVDDPSGTAVERFLKWERNTTRRAAALSCALPQEIDEDIYQTIVSAEARGEFDWLQSMPFFINRAGRGHYHEVVRSAMLRLQRQQSPRRWKDSQTRLAEEFERRRVELENSSTKKDRWNDERWRNFRLQETYHRLCADHHAELPDTLREILDASENHIAILRRWAQNLTRAGTDAGSTEVLRWGLELSKSLEEDEPKVAALTLLLNRGNLPPSEKSFAYTLRAKEYLSNSDYQRALNDCNASLALESTLPAHYIRAESNRAMEAYIEALSDFNRALEIDSAFVPAIRGRGLTYLAMRKHDEAIAEFTRAVEISDDPRNLAHRGDALRIAKRYEEALIDFNRAIITAPNYAWAIENRAQTFANMGLFDKALADYNRAVELRPNYSWTLAARGRLLEDMEEHQRAFDDFNRAIEIGPNDTFALIGRSELHLRRGQFEESLADASRALQTDSKDGFAFTNRGNIYRILGRLEEALEDVNQAIEINPRDTFARGIRGSIKRVQGQYLESLSDLNSSIAINPDSMWVNYERSIALYALDNSEWEASASRTLNICASPQVNKPTEIARVGILVLTYCLYSQWMRADEHLSCFLDLNPRRGDRAELLVELNSLQPLMLPGNEHLSSMSNRLERAMREQ